MIGVISAGGNLTAVISHLYCGEKLSPPLTGICLSVPILLSPEAAVLKQGAKSERADIEQGSFWHYSEVCYKLSLLDV